MSGQAHAAMGTNTDAMHKKRPAGASHEQKRVRVKKKPKLPRGHQTSSALNATVLTAEARVYNDASVAPASTAVALLSNGSGAVSNSSTTGCIDVIHPEARVYNDASVAPASTAVVSLGKGSGAVPTSITTGCIDEKINIIRHGRSVIMKFLQKEQKEQNDGKWIETMSGENTEKLESIIVLQRNIIQQLMSEQKKRSEAGAREVEFDFNSAKKVYSLPHDPRAPPQHQGDPNQGCTGKCSESQPCWHRRMLGFRRNVGEMLFYSTQGGK